MDGCEHVESCDGQSECEANRLWRWWHRRHRENCKKYWYRTIMHVTTTGLVSYPLPFRIHRGNFALLCDAPQSSFRPAQSSKVPAFRRRNDFFRVSFGEIAQRHRRSYPSKVAETRSTKSASATSVTSDLPRDETSHTETQKHRNLGRNRQIRFQK